VPLDSVKRAMALNLPLHLTCKPGDVASFAIERGGTNDGVPMLNLSVTLKIQLPVTDLVNALAGFQESVTSVPKVVPRPVVEAKQTARTEPSPEPQSHVTHSATPHVVAERSTALEDSSLPTHMQSGPMLPKAMMPANNSSSHLDWTYPVARLQTGHSEYVTKNNFATLDGMNRKPKLHGASLNDYQCAELKPPVRVKRTYANQHEHVALEPPPWQSSESGQASINQAAQRASFSSVAGSGSVVAAKCGLGVLANAQPAPKKQSAPYPKSVAPKPVPVPPRNITPPDAAQEGT